MKSEHVVIDNFLDKKDFDNILDVIPVELPWGFNQTIADFDETPVNSTDYYLSHLFYGLNPRSEDNGLDCYIPFCFSDKIAILAPILKKLDPRFVMRIKANLFPNTPKLVEHNSTRDWGSVLNQIKAQGWDRIEGQTNFRSRVGCSKHSLEV